MPSAIAKVATKPAATELVPLSHLLLDKGNPRFGYPDKPTANQADILDNIVEKFGVDDVLSSLAVNGYFHAEPIVCKTTSKPNEYIVAEGNRRLAACLILTGDPRAARQKPRTQQFGAIWKKHNSPSIDPIPVIKFDPKKDAHALLSYLGVRHIASSQAWDSYAKAAWVAHVVETENIEIADVALMIGDQHRTISRLLQGFYFIRQVIEAGKFRPEDSVRKGRGSVTEYPFSWVYTLLGYSTARTFLGLPDEGARSDPVPKKNLNQAALVTTAMFGNRSLGRSAAIEDSRQLGDLASALASPEKVSLLQAGRTIKEIERTTKPIQERLTAGLGEVREIQTDLLAGLAEAELPAATAAPFIDISSKNRRTAAEIEKKLTEIAGKKDD
jgi:hypothetical protein